MDKDHGVIGFLHTFQDPAQQRLGLASEAEGSAGKEEAGR